MNLISIKVAANNIKNIFLDYLHQSREIEKQQIDLIKDTYKKEDELKLDEIRRLIK